jgi:hypothetical protein
MIELTSCYTGVTDSRVTWYDVTKVCVRRGVLWYEVTRCHTGH